MLPGFVSRLVDRPLLREALVPLGTFIGFVIVGIGGFMILADDIGPLEAAVWLADLTSLELYIRDNGGPERQLRAHSMLVTGALVVTGLWIGETVLTAAFGGQIHEEVTQARMEQRIEETTDHVVVCGYGMFGRTVANHLSEAGWDVVVIEIDCEPARRVREDGHMLVEGDARREHTLTSAGIDRASKLVTAIDDSNVNIQIAIVGNKATDAPETIVRVGDEMYESVAREAGADRIVIPEVVSGERITRSLERPTRQ